MHKRQLRELVYKMMGCMESESTKAEGLLIPFLECDCDNEIMVSLPICLKVDT